MFQKLGLFFLSVKFKCSALRNKNFCTEIKHYIPHAADREEAQLLHEIRTREVPNGYLQALSRDATFLYRYAQVRGTWAIIKAKNMSVGEVFEQSVRRHPDRIMVHFENSAFAYKQINANVNKLARYFQSFHYKKGDVIAIFFRSKPEYIMLMLAFAKIGVTGALINTNAKNEVLLHSLKVVHCQAAVVSTNLLPIALQIQSPAATKIDVMIEDLRELHAPVKIFQLDGLSSNHPNIHVVQQEMENFSEDPPEVHHEVNLLDPLVYIFTSGTTGLPKAAILPHSKFILNALGINHLLGLKQNDLIYNTLPLYHTSGLVIGTGPSIVCGIPVVLRRKFSAKHFWHDCRQYGSTSALYIGEICQYLLYQSPDPRDSQHAVRRVFGNGLQKGLWENFSKRFNVTVKEFYGATESNCNMINIDATVGAVGFVPFVIPKRFDPMCLIHVNEDTLEPVRDHNGLCRICDYGEPGMLVGMISKRPESKFFGYVRHKSEKNVIIRDVRKNGDSAFATGDILIMDKYRYMYFVDRKGDTFRWKGENVATAEVESVISLSAHYAPCVVYGVKVVNNPGKAGMVAIVEKDGHTIDIDNFYQFVHNHLPHFSQPLFVRLVDKLHTTGTFKVIKRQYIQEGFNPDVVKDKLYYLNKKNGRYEILTKKVYSEIMAEKITF